VSLKIFKIISKEVSGKQKVLFPYFYFYVFSQSLSVFLEKMSRDLSKSRENIISLCFPLFSWQDPS
jgi:hypothetical protein